MGPSEGLAPLHKTSSEDDVCPSPPLHMQSHSSCDNNPPVLEQVNTTVHSSITFRSVSPIAWDFQSTQQVTPPPILLYPEAPRTLSVCKLSKRREVFKATSRVQSSLEIIHTRQTVWHASAR
ncbi:hypothetical protein E2C01_021025 [Portunus trituberculatus]|uniref:Uncharacterized protein n=1 Tax=Portunus trituberculatus TaxID=210409 RepID=A0A5B7E254_PORTR|nr:hypothetical protein [Portunus trituberculatus]